MMGSNQKADSSPEIDVETWETDMEQCPLNQDADVSVMDLGQVMEENTAVLQPSNATFEPIREGNVLLWSAIVPNLPSQDLHVQQVIPENDRNRIQYSRQVRGISSHLSNSPWSPILQNPSNVQLLSKYPNPTVENAFPSHCPQHQFVLPVQENPISMVRNASPSNFSQNQFILQLQDNPIPIVTCAATSQPPQQSQTGVTPKRKRTTFTASQVMGLENQFKIDINIEATRKSQLAQSLGLTERQVTSWFANRRMKRIKELATAGRASRLRIRSVSSTSTAGRTSRLRIQSVSSASTAPSGLPALGSQQLVQEGKYLLRGQVALGPSRVRVISDQSTVANEAANVAAERQENQTLVPVTISGLQQYPTNLDLQDPLEPSVYNLGNPTLKPEMDPTDDT